MKKYILGVLIVLSLQFVSCETPGNKCEAWKYHDVCIPKTRSTQCAENGIQTSLICGQEVKDAHAGKATIEQENAYVKIERHYVKKVD